MEELGGKRSSVFMSSSSLLFRLSLRSMAGGMLARWQLLTSYTDDDCLLAFSAAGEAIEAVSAMRFCFCSKASARIYSILRAYLPARGLSSVDDGTAFSELVLVALESSFVIIC